MLAYRSGADQAPVKRDLPDPAPYTRIRERAGLICEQLAGSRERFWRLDMLPFVSCDGRHV